MLRKLLKSLVINKSETFEPVARNIGINNFIKTIVYRSEEIKTALKPFELEFLARNLIRNPSDYPSQLGQDLFAEIVTKGKENGYFIEIGVGDGKHLSNTYFLEKNKKWNGILCEPNKSFHGKISKERSAFLCKDAIYSESGLKLNFLCVTDGLELSTLEVSKGQDRHNRSNVEEYSVETLTFYDLCKKYNVPEEIDFISIDTEGSELEILKTIDFSVFKINVLAIEHNNDLQRIEFLKKYMEERDFYSVNLALTQWDILFVRKSFLGKIYE